MGRSPRSTTSPEATLLPALQTVDSDRVPADGEVRVTSPTGARTVVRKDQVEALKLQGYREG